MGFMRNIVCPISTERIAEHVPRITALYVLATLIIYLMTGFVPLLLFLLVDFIMRGAGIGQFSVLHVLASGTSKGLSLKSGLIDKAPKLFAARLGAFVIGLAVVFHLVSLTSVAVLLSSAVIFFAALESAFNFCVGCHVYNFIVLPFFSKRR
jgi:hypothetical protein